MDSNPSWPPTSIAQEPYCWHKKKPSRKCVTAIPDDITAQTKTLLPKIMLGEMKGLEGAMAIFERHVGQKLFPEGKLDATDATGVFDGYLNAKVELITELKTRTETLEVLLKGDQSR